jgi:GH15 family glucan-1,4-alpha-glucosidase
MQLELPDERVAQAVDANRAYLLLLHDGNEITPGPMTYHRFWFRDASYLVAALDRFGFHDEAAEVLASYPARQHADGFYFSQRQEWDANGCALWCLAHHWQLTRDRDLIAPMAGSIARGAQWIERKRHTKRRRRDENLRGLLPAGISAEHLGPYDYFYWDDFWAVAGLRAAATLLTAVDEGAASADAGRFAAAMWDDLRRSLALTAELLGTEAIPAGPRRLLDAGAIGSLVACSPLALLAADDPAIVATAELIRSRFVDGVPFFQSISHTGHGTYLTMQLATVELEAGDRRALERFQWLLDAATSTWSWPEAIHPRVGGGCMGDGHHGWAAADFLSFVRSMLVREISGGRGLALCSMLPETWHGHGLEVHDAPTAFGRLSYALRWHGDRPALLWELDPHEDVGDVTLVAPGLDPAWSASELSGEALLSPAGDAAREGVSFA